MSVCSMCLWVYVCTSVCVSVICVWYVVCDVCVCVLGVCVVWCVYVCVVYVCVVCAPWCICAGQRTIFGSLLCPAIFFYMSPRD